MRRQLLASARRCRETSLGALLSDTDGPGYTTYSFPNEGHAQIPVLGLVPALICLA